MYYHLKDRYNLKGWELLPYAVVDTETHRADFVDKAKFDALTLCDGSVDLDLPLISEAVRHAFELCRDRGFPTGAEMCLWRENAHTLRESISYLEDFYRDLPQIHVHLGGFFLADGRNPDEYRLPAVHVVKDPENICMCAHARTSMYISAEDRTLVCMPISNNDEFQADYPLIQELGLKKCLTQSKYLELINTRAGTVLSHNEKCKSCEYRRLCLGGCRAAGLMCHPGDILAPDEFTCKVFLDGWIYKIEEKVSGLRPDAECIERRLLKEEQY